MCRDAEGASPGRMSACPRGMLYLNTFIFFIGFPTNHPWRVGDTKNDFCPSLPLGPSSSLPGTPSRTAAALGGLSLAPAPWHLRLSLSRGCHLAIHHSLFMSLDDGSCYLFINPWRARIVCCWPLCGTHSTCSKAAVRDSKIAHRAPGRLFAVVGESSGHRSQSFVLLASVGMAWVSRRSREGLCTSCCFN